MSINGTTLSPPAVRVPPPTDGGLSGGSICAIVAGVVIVVAMSVTLAAYVRHYMSRVSVVHEQRRYAEESYSYGTPDRVGGSAERARIFLDEALGESPTLGQGSGQSSRQSSMRKNPLADI